jgi:hypothetical protein
MIETVDLRRLAAATPRPARKGKASSLLAGSEDALDFRFARRRWP